MDRAVLWLARGGGLGLLPKAPGTWGSLGGIAWTALLLLPGNLWIFIAGAVLGVAASIWICGRAEQILDQTDPGEIVIDEIIALPICYLGLLIPLHLNNASITLAALANNAATWYWAAAGFAIFRLFDIWKPTPIRQLQNLPGGWGVTLDDLLAAIYTAVVLQLTWQLLK
jgi:phosphatidylglycerophosphatase A